jgi:hypothetical protein
MLINLAPSDNVCIKYILVKEPNIFISNNDLVFVSFYKSVELFKYPERLSL